jgi:hypothetical protein
MKEVAKPVYDHLNSISKGEWQTDWKNWKQAETDMQGLSRGVDDDKIAELKQRAKILGQKVYGVIKDPRSGLSPEVVNQTVRNFRTHYLLDEAHRRIASIYDVEANRPLRSGTYQGIGTSRVGEQWRQFMKDNPDARDVIGGARADSLQRLFDMNESRASRRQLAAAIYGIARHFAPLPKTGIAGHLANSAISSAVQGLVASPKAAKSLMFAMESGAKPENYAPGIAKMIRGVLGRAGKAALPAAAGTLTREDNKPS